MYTDIVISSDLNVKFLDFINEQPERQLSHTLNISILQVSELSHTLNILIDLAGNWNVKISRWFDKRIYSWLRLVWTRSSYLQAQQGFSVVRTSFCFYGRGLTFHLVRTETTVPIKTKCWTINYLSEVREFAKFGRNWFSKRSPTWFSVFFFYLSVSSTYWCKRETYIYVHVHPFVEGVEICLQGGEKMFLRLGRNASELWGYKSLQGWGSNNASKESSLN